VLRLRKQVDYWKEQAGLTTAEARATADLREIVDRRPTPGPDGADAQEQGATTPRAAAGPAGGRQTSQLSLASAAAAMAGCGEDGSVAGGCGASTGGWSEVEGAAGEEAEQ
jgi:hypothetical protein